MKGLVLLLIVSLGCISLVHAENIVVPTSASLSSESGDIRFGSPSALIDGSGLSGGGYTTGDAIPAAWQTAALHGTGDGTDWLTCYSSSGGMFVELDLGDTYLIQDVVLWAYAASDWTNRGIDSADFYASEDGGANWTFIQSFSPNECDGTDPEQAQVFSFSSSFYANAIRLDGQTRSSDASLVEILFIEDEAIPAKATSPGPVNRNAADATATTVAAWSAPKHADISSVDSYDVYFGTSSDVTSNPISSVTSESLSVSLNPGVTYYWRVDSNVSVVGGGMQTLIGDLWTFWTIPTRTTNNLDLTPSWYVADTTAGEWIEFTDVYFSEGSYRFTGYLGAVAAGNTVSLFLNGISLGTVTVPVTGGLENFELVHLGHTTLAEGYYDVRLTFNTGNISADMIYVRKSVDTSNSVYDDDIVSPQPSLIDGCSITPITTRDGKGDYPIGKSAYSDAQNLAWYKQPMYKEMLFDESLYALLDEQISARVDFAWIHGKYTLDTDDWGYDRDYVPENGDGSSNKTKRYYEVLLKHPFADYLKFGYFVDNATYGSSYTGNTGDPDPQWGNADFQQFVWDYWTKPFFDAIPADRLYTIDNHVLVNFWEADCGVNGDAGISDFMNDFANRIKNEYGYDTYLIVNKQFIDQDPDVESIVQTRQTWFGWFSDDNVNHSTVNDITVSFMTNGRKLPLNTIWETDWDPETNTGTRNNTQYSDDGEYQPTHTDGVADFRTGLDSADSMESQWMLLEAWANHQEGSAWYRSDHVDWNYPNEFISISREFADKATSAILLQAEGCDTYRDSTPGNAGRSYRYYWHAGAESDLDIYRPCRRIHGFAQHSNPPVNLTDITGGEYDIWAIDNSGDPKATEMDGNGVWNSATDGGHSFEFIEIGREAWGIVGADVYRATMPRGWHPWNTGSWTLIASNVNFVDVSVNIRPYQVWAVDTSRAVWVGDQRDGNFTEVTGATLTDIAAGESFVWGVTTNDELVKRDIERTLSWETIANPLGLVELKAGSNEIWGLTASGDLYRNSEHGEGPWELIMSDVMSCGPAREFVWILRNDGTVHWSKITGFEEATTGAGNETPPEAPAGLKVTKMRGQISY